MSKNHKKHNDLFKLIVADDNIDKAYHKALKGDGKYNPEAIRFAEHETFNLRMLKDSLLDESYQFDGYIRFPVFEPKKRIVDAPHFKDKIIQLAINNVLRDVYKEKFIYDSYACIKGKGTHKCAERIQSYMKRAQWEYGDGATIIKADVEKFFYSIDREVLKNILPKAIKCKKTLRLIFKIIDSAEVIDPLGLPLGNTLSQICANIYLNELDQFCKRQLKAKYYIRYMDDIIIIVPSKQEALKVLKGMECFTEKKLMIKLNPMKTKNFPLRQGVNAIGYKIHPTHKLLRNQSKKKLKRRIKAMPELIVEGKLTIKRAEAMLNSWMGHASHANSHNFINRILKRYDFIYWDSKGKGCFRINLEKIGGYYGNDNYKLSSV